MITALVALQEISSIIGVSQMPQFSQIGLHNLALNQGVKNMQASAH